MVIFNSLLYFSPNIVQCVVFVFIAQMRWEEQREHDSNGWRMSSENWGWSILAVISWYICPDFSVRNVHWEKSPFTHPHYTSSVTHPVVKIKLLEFPEFADSNLSHTSPSQDILPRRQIVFYLSLFSRQGFSIAFHNGLICVGSPLFLIQLEMQDDWTTIVFQIVQILFEEDGRLSHPIMLSLWRVHLCW